jgi:isopenicillin-N epimerase
MTMKRRDVLRSVLALGGASAAPAFAQEQPSPLVIPPGSGAPDDEVFWKAVRDQFDPTWEARSNLVTVVRGVTPRAIREHIAAESVRFNAFGAAQAPSADWRQRLMQAVAAFIGAPPDSVALLRNTTEGVTTVFNNWPLSRGDEILTSSAEHGPFFGAVAARAARDGIVPKQFHLPAPTTSLDAVVAAVDAAMTPRTRLVSIGQVVLTGQIMPVRAIADLVHRRGALLMVDGVLGIGHVPTDVAEMDCDFYAAGFHKFACGPRATAVFYVRPSLVERLPPLFGAVAIDATGRTVPLGSSNRMAKYEAIGAHPDAHFTTLERSIEFLGAIGVDRIRARFFALTSRWYTRAQRVKGFRAAVALHPAHCAGLVAFEIDGVSPTELAEAIRARGVLTGGTERYGGFFGIPATAPRSLRVVNASLFTAPADVDRLADALEAVNPKTAAVNP